jgi:hypothetical protein
MTVLRAYLEESVALIAIVLAISCILVWAAIITDHVETSRSTPVKRCPVTTSAQVVVPVCRG